MYSLVKKLTDLKPYTPITGDFRIRLDANESFIKPDAQFLFKAAENLSLNRYPDPYAAGAVKAFSSLYGVNPDMVTASNGSDELISIITSCFLEKGDRILCLSRDFSMYYFYPMIYELEMLILEKEKDLSINTDKIIETVVKNNVKCVILSNPCNPTSLGISAAEIKRLVSSVNALVVVDEAYMEFWNESVLNETELHNNLIVLKTCSKALSLAGARLGFAVCCPKLTTALKAAKSPYNVNSFTQEIGRLVLSDKQKVMENIEAVKASINFLYSEICGFNFTFFKKVYKTRTNFLFIETQDAESIFNFLLKKSIAVRCLGNHLRITCGTPEENIELINAFKTYDTERGRLNVKNSKYKA